VYFLTALVLGNVTKQLVRSIAFDSVLCFLWPSLLLNSCDLTMCITVCVYLFVLISFCIFSQSVGSLVSGKDTIRFLRVGFRKYGALVSFVDFGAMYIVALFYRLLPHLSFFLHFFLICLFLAYFFSFENRPSPFPGQRSLEATKGPNVGFFSCFRSFYVIVFSQY